MRTLELKMKKLALHNLYNNFSLRRENSVIKKLFQRNIFENCNHTLLDRKLRRTSAGFNGAFETRHE